MTRVTSRDVAKAAGVSQTTVSFVLNGRADQGISRETRDNVLAQAHALGYVPSAAARSLRMGTSGVVLCILPDWPVTQAMEEFRISLSATLAGADLSCVYFHQSSGAGPATASLWQQTNPAVIVAFGELDESDSAAVARAGIPLLNGVFGANTAALTGLDQRSIGSTQVEHLANKGHRRIAFCHPVDPREDRFGRPRFEGARDTCRQLGLEPLIELALDGSSRPALTAVTTAAAENVTAIAAANDLAALAVVDACRTLNLNVPVDLAVIGVDDLAAASLVSPRLSTVSINLSGYARHLAQSIVDEILSAHLSKDGDCAAESFTVIEREST